MQVKKVRQISLFHFADKIVVVSIELSDCDYRTLPYTVGMVHFRPLTVRCVSFCCHIVENTMHGNYLNVNEDN